MRGSSPRMTSMAKDKIRVTTHAGPGAPPVIRTVPWPDVPKKAALIKIGACGVCGAGESQGDQGAQQHGCQ